MHALMVALCLLAEPHAKSDADQVVAQAFAAPMEKAAPESAAPVGALLGWGLALSAAAALVVFAMRRRQQGVTTGFAQLQQNLSVGPKRSLLVVAFGNRRMLLGATDTGFFVLASEPVTATQTAFDATLEQQLQQWAAEKRQGDAS
jgi:flagellar biogenesis protein FliO